MCYNLETSRRAFLFGVLSGLCLMKFGNAKHSDINKTLGIFFIFVSFMQYVEYLIWSDLKCVNGNNALAGTIGPLLNYLQPTMLFVLAMIYIKKRNLSNDDIFPIILNVGYLIYVVFMYLEYMKGNKCTKIKNGHLKWSWRNMRMYIFYNLIAILNIVYYLNDNVSIFAFSLSYVYFFISMFNFNKHLGEIWCFLVTNIPLMVLIYEKIIG
jgi:hypothetical protein